jgi:integrase
MVLKEAAAACIASYTGKDTNFRVRLSFWVERFGEKSITEIVPADIEAGIDLLAVKKKIRYVTRKGYIETGEYITGATVNRYVAAMATMYKILKQRRRVPAGFRPPTLGASSMQEGEARTLSVSMQDIKRLIDCAKLSHNRELAAFIALAATTGLRKSNITALKWRDLGDGYVDVQVTKNGRPIRSVLLPWVEQELRAIRRKGDTDTSNLFKVKNPMKAYRMALADAQLPTDWTIHHLRHVAASVLAQNGASTIEIMSVLNHKTPNMAMRYSHLNTTAQVKVMEAAWG